MQIWILFRYLYRKARILTMTTNHEPKVNTKIKGIRLLNNFEILYDCVIARKAYQVGIGTIDIKSLKNPHLDHKEMTGMKHIELSVC